MKAGARREAVSRAGDMAPLESGLIRNKLSPGPLPTGVVSRPASLIG